MVQPVADRPGEMIEEEGQGIEGCAGQDEHFVSVPGEAVEFLDLIEGGDGIGTASDKEDAGKVVVDPAGRMEFCRTCMKEAGQFAQAGRDEGFGEPAGVLAANVLNGKAEIGIGRHGNDASDAGVVEFPTKGKDRTERMSDNRDWKIDVVSLLDLGEESAQIVEFLGAEIDALAGGAAMAAEIDQDTAPALFGKKQSPGEHRKAGNAVTVEENDRAAGSCFG